MARPISMPIQKLPNGRWQLDIPSSFAPNGKRRRPTFTSKAKAEVYKGQVLKGREILKQHARVEANDVTEVSRARELIKNGGRDWPGVMRLAEFWCQHQAVTPHTLADVVSEHWTAKAKNRRSEYRKDIKLCTGRMLEQLGPETLISNVSPGDLENAIGRAWPGIHPGHFNKVRRTLRPVWSFAEARGWVEGDIFKRILTRDHQKKNTVIYTVEQVEALLSHTTEINRAFWILGIFCGVRPMEIERLGWEDINLKQSRLVIRRDVSKVRRPRKVELEPNVVVMLTPLVGTPICPEKNARKLLEAPRYDAGLTGLGGDIARHTYASYHLAKYNDLAKLQANLGHSASSSVTLTNYYDLVLDDDAEDFWLIGSPLA